MLIGRLASCVIVLKHFITNVLEYKTTLNLKFKCVYVAIYVLLSDESLLT